MGIEIGDLVEAIALLDGKKRKGVVTGFFDGSISVELVTCHTLCKDPQPISLDAFDTTERWWIAGKRQELQKEREHKEAHPNEVTHYE
jgi:hypothetical protein